MISVVICSIDEAKFSAVLSMYARQLDGHAFEIIHIPDAKGICEGYNRGVSLSRGDIIVFSHDDIEIHCENFRARLLGHMEHCDLLGIAGTNRLCAGSWLSAGAPYVFGQVIHSRTDINAFRALVYSAPKRLILNMQALDGVLLCCKRQVAQKVPFDQDTFPGYHMYDLDFTFRAYLAGYRLAVACDLDVVHSAVSRYDQAWENEEAVFCRKHAANLAPRPPRSGFLGFVLAPTLQEALDVLRPRFWDD